MKGSEWCGYTQYSVMVNKNYRNSMFMCTDFNYWLKMHCDVRAFKDTETTTTTTRRGKASLMAVVLFYRHIRLVSTISFIITWNSFRYSGLSILHVRVHRFPLNAQKLYFSANNVISKSIFSLSRSTPLTLALSAFSLSRVLLDLF